MPPAAGIAIVAIALMIFPLGVVYAQATDGADIELPGAISGRYIDPASGAEIDLPAGWTGIDYFGSALVSPDGVNEVMSSWPQVSMMVIVVERSDLEDRIAAAKGSQAGADDGCSTLSTAYIKMGGMDSMEIVKECSTGGYMKSKIYMVPTPAKAAIVAFTAGSEEQYDNYLAAFEQSARTLQMGDGTVDIRSFVSRSLGLATSSHQITVAGKPVSLTIDSSSQISGLGFDDVSRQISFTVDGRDGTKGTTIIPISWVLEDPYIVAIDGKAADYDIIHDETTGETRIRLDYGHSIHKVTVSGTAVVPEFPVPLVGAVAAVIGAVAIMGRIRLGRTQP